MFFDRLRQNKVALTGGPVIALFGPYLTPYDPLKVDLRLSLNEPSWAYPFGNDEVGRDILSRVIAGAHFFADRARRCRDRAVGWILWRSARHRDHARDRCYTGLSQLAVGNCHLEYARPWLAQHDERHRYLLDSQVHTLGTRLYPTIEAARLRRRSARRRRAQSPHPAGPYPAQHRCAHHRAGHLAHEHDDPHRGRSELYRARGATAHA